MRFSLRTLFLVFIIVGASCAALLYPRYLWSSAYFTVALFMVLCAGIGSCTASGQARAYWIGFAVLGSGYFLCSMFGDVQAYSPAQGSRATWSEPRLLTSHLILWCNDQLNYLRPERTNQLVGGAPYSKGAALQMQFIARGSAGHTLIIGQALFTLLFGLMGGWLARWHYRRNEANGTGDA